MRFVLFAATALSHLTGLASGQNVDDCTVQRVLYSCEMTTKLNSDGIQTMDESVAVTRWVPFVSGVGVMLAYNTGQTRKVAGAARDFRCRA